MIHIVIGTKAQLIKMAPIMWRLQERGLPYRFIYTGQHRETMDDILRDFRIKAPDVVLYDGPEVTSIGQMFYWFFHILRLSFFKKEFIWGDRPRGIVLVHGDTISTLLGALMGRLGGLHVGHVESGLRSFNLFHPFPEEITRLLTFRLCHTLYCPGSWATENVSGLNREIIDIKANTMADTLALSSRSATPPKDMPPPPYALVSLHRFENIFRKEKLITIIEHLEHIAVSHRLIFILHPPTKKQLLRFALYDRLQANSNIELRPRYNHSEFMAILTNADFVISDGGSLQEETSYLGIPCLLMRKTTERKEGLGTNVVLSGYQKTIIDEFVRTYDQNRHPGILNQVSPSDMVIESALRYA